MTKIHFVYAGDPHGTSTVSPYTITQNLYKFLRSKGLEVLFYDWYHTGPLAPVGRDDIILAHPNYEQGTASWRLFDSQARAKCLIFPFHHAMPEINLPFDPLVAKADRVFSVTGQYWYDTMDGTPFAHWKPKMVRLDMAVDVDHFPFVKDRFNQPGQRHIVYMGCDRPEKGLDLLYEVMRRVPGHQLHVYGSVDGGNRLFTLPNVHSRGWASITPEWAADLARMADIFMNTSRSDANPTTLLEFAAMGFITCCTPQSGYYADQRSDGMFHGLNPHDPDGIMELIYYLNRQPEAELVRHARAARAVVAAKYNWSVFCGRVWDHLQDYL